ncbi:MAG: hypothetical protein RB191_02150 [Terriglobia bacterium]|nr:hypothetical protein [Terriglobia bacterium]
MRALFASLGLITIDKHVVALMLALMATAYGAAIRAILHAIATFVAAIPAAVWAYVLVSFAIGTVATIAAKRDNIL